MTAAVRHRRPVCRTAFYLGVLLCVGVSGTFPAHADGPPPTEPAATPSNYSQSHDIPPTTPTPPADPNERFRLDTESMDYGSVEDDKPLATSGGNRAEFRAYNRTIIQANQFTADELERVARKDVTFADLVRPVRKDYQFDVVYLEGRLRRLRRFEPEQQLKDAGIDVMYEGWMFPHDTADPICVLTTELPPGLTLTEPPSDYSPPIPVTVAGYYFKLYWYESSQPDPKDPLNKIIRRAPLIMAKSFNPIPAPTADGGFWLGEFLPGLLLFLVAVTAVLMTLNWNFRRGDRRLAAERTARFERDNPFGDGEPAVIPD